MAHSLSAKKRIRQNARRRARNRARKKLIREQIKLFSSALGAGDLVKAEDEFKKVVQRLCRTADKGTIHKNAAARQRSRLARRLNAARAQAGGAGTQAATA